MNWLIEFFQTLFTHRRVIQKLEAQKLEHFRLALIQTQTISQLEQAIRSRDHALSSLAAPDPVQIEQPIVVREVFRRPTYAEQQRQYERQNQLRFRQMDEARVRREQQETK